ncbi:MAG: hypothetical protein HWD59_01945 [Coxiellaceae bacterium]|nr:MAG: hypothetical protein HWD59_01945 [Coxiellaceae bacterium]
MSTLYKKLPNNTMKFYGSLLAASVIIGHLCQGGLDGMTFADTINKEAEPWVKLAVAGGLGLLVTIFEGHTEMRSALLNLTNNEQYHDIRALSKLLLMPAAAFHGLIPTVGLLEIVTSIYKIITHTTLPNSLMIRIPLFIGSSIVVGLANGKTFHDATVPTFNRTVNAIDYKFSQIQKTWHRQNQREEKQPLIRDIHVESGLVFN